MQRVFYFSTDTIQKKPRCDQIWKLLTSGGFGSSGISSGMSLSSYLVTTASPCPGSPLLLILILKQKSLLFKLTLSSKLLTKYTGTEGDGCGAKPEGAGNQNIQSSKKLRKIISIFWRSTKAFLSLFRCCKREEQPLEEEDEVEQKDTGIPWKLEKRIFGSKQKWQKEWLWDLWKPQNPKCGHGPCLKKGKGPYDCQQGGAKKRKLSKKCWILIRVLLLIQGEIMATCYLTQTHPKNAVGIIWNEAP